MTAATPPRALQVARHYLELVKFSHTIFALPFALAAMLVAAKGLPSAPVFVWIVVAMIGARTAAMGFNRIVDRQIDARNPRTANRELPAGKVSSAGRRGSCCRRLDFIFHRGLAN